MLVNCFQENKKETCRDTISLSKNLEKGIAQYKVVLKSSLFIKRSILKFKQYQYSLEQGKIGIKKLFSFKK